MADVAKKPVRRVLDPAVDLRVRIFTVLAMAGVAASLLIGLVNLFSGAGAAAVLVDFAVAGLSAGLIFYAHRSQNYRVCYLITIVVIFMGLFPFLFFRMGGYHGGTTLFLVFAVVFTVFLLEGRMALAVTVLELLLYTGLYLYAYYNPAAVQAFSAEQGFLVSNLSDLLVASIALGVTMYAQIRLYRQQQKKVDEQNEVLAQARGQLLQAPPDVIVPDIMLPDGDGLDFMRELRGGSHSSVPVLLLTGLSAQADVLRGLRSGGDDYLTKPYDFEILLARAEALLRRAERIPERLVQGRPALDVSTGTALLDETDLLLTQKEFALLLLFVQNPDRYMDGEYLYEKVWKQPLSSDTSALKSTIKRLRMKLAGSGRQIAWSRGEGYCLEIE